MQQALQVQGAGYRYGDVRALDGVDLTVAAGSCVALLGPNGAGKTTLVSMVTGLLPPRTGSVRVLGRDPRTPATRAALGVVQQKPGFPRTLTVRELVVGAARRAGLSSDAADPVIAEVGLADLGRRRVHRLSGGQQQRLQLARALVTDPILLVLDEPTVGLDLAARRDFWHMLAARRDHGMAVLLTTHLVEEAGAVADRVVVLSEGRVVANGTPALLTSRLPDRTVSARTQVPAARLAADPDVLRVEVEPDPGGAAPLVRLSTAAPEAVLRRLLAADPELSALRVEGARLEEAVLALTDNRGPVGVVHGTEAGTRGDAASTTGSTVPPAASRKATA